MDLVCACVCVWWCWWAGGLDRGAGGCSTRRVANGVLDKRHRWQQHVGISHRVCDAAVGAAHRAAARTPRRVTVLREWRPAPRARGYYDIRLDH